MCLLRPLTTLLIALLAALSVRAADAPAAADTVPPLRPVASIFAAEVGVNSMWDTYLSPIRYTGAMVSLGYTATQATGFAPDRWVRQLAAAVEYSHPANPPGNHHYQWVMAEVQWAIMRRTSVLHGGLMLGGDTRLRGGAVYSPHNSNNLVSVRAHWSVGAAAQAVWNTRLARTPLTMSTALSLPVLGVFFSPEYDESYYEIYLGNRDGLAHLGWWGNRFDLDLRYNADFHLRATIVRLGLHYRLERTAVSHLSTRSSSLSVVLGVGGEVLSLPRSGINPAARIISAMY